MNRYAIADLHLDHHNIIRLTNRPFKSIKNMQESIIGSWNNVVKKDDIVYILGDLWMNVDTVAKLGRLLVRLNGRKVLILGNHDNIKPFTYVNHGIESVHTSLTLSHEETGFSCTTYLAHDPAVYTCLPDDSFMVCGHVHKLFKSQKGCVNVGVDVWDFKPVLLMDLYNIYIDYVLSLGYEKGGIKCEDIIRE